MLNIQNFVSRHKLMQFQMLLKKAKERRSIIKKENEINDELEKTKTKTNMMDDKYLNELKKIGRKRSGLVQKTRPTTIWLTPKHRLRVMMKDMKGRIGLNIGKIIDKEWDLSNRETEQIEKNLRRPLQILEKLLKDNGNSSKVQSIRRFLKIRLDILCIYSSGQISHLLSKNELSLVDYVLKYRTSKKRSSNLIRIKTR